MKVGAGPVLAAATSGFRLLQQAVITANLIHLLAASILLDDTLDAALPVRTALETILGGNGGGEDDGSQTPDNLAFLFLAIHKYGYFLALFFFGISMALLGVACLLHGIL